MLHASVQELVNAPGMSKNGILIGKEQPDPEEVTKLQQELQRTRELEDKLKADKEILQQKVDTLKKGNARSPEPNDAYEPGAR